ncbi:MAG: type II toxin-antitoxin system HicA family toxin [Dokdonella sp.]|jgi:mRNA interferase HicA|uniref:type II toxin-antitoxin system HicA family toxin n=1 Tax=Dokdonella sp. TaxID=2291710 RepID=UPI001B719C5D|nr:type II toxin-antitoxin system HicA family toxin [Dokdonella sp.]MBK8122015.1 type II toxin-antitoxin system HicA family toxin [Dokdonella sp.]MBP6326683.1 type II toxin-antitoxin system HicA family toxin [Dokdonella sp.]MBP6328504.1 type II toxin-antitoxin system HicA family toxin [Dokdonella sp.]HQV49058.1 type II toxin-antitoxin system HicA family toxin [Dokdonella sp.]HQV49060.1 type II toxin-antitoxin system HicA family toxin [Dokdonella sp.]
MKRRDLLAHLQANGCSLLREGGKHSWWVHSVSGKRSAVPRHNEVNDHLARKICRDLGVPEPTRF